MRLCCQEMIKKKRERKKRKKIKTIQQAMKDLMNTEVQNVKVKELLGKTIKILRVLIMNFG
jgi:HSP90 family molecular chaperone